jgi:hypothetical protein
LDHDILDIRKRESTIEDHHIVDSTREVILGSSVVGATQKVVLTNGGIGLSNRVVNLTVHISPEINTIKHNCHMMPPAVVKHNAGGRKEVIEESHNSQARAPIHHDIEGIVV